MHAGDRCDTFEPPWISQQVMRCSNREFTREFTEGSTSPTNLALLTITYPTYGRGKSLGPQLPLKGICDRFSCNSLDPLEKHIRNNDHQPPTYPLASRFLQLYPP